METVISPKSGAAFHIALLGDGRCASAGSLGGPGWQPLGAAQTQARRSGQRPSWAGSQALAAPASGGQAAAAAVCGCGRGCCGHGYLGVAAAWRWFGRLAAMGRTRKPDRWRRGVVAGRVPSTTTPSLPGQREHTPRQQKGPKGPIAQGCLTGQRGAVSRCLAHIGLHAGAPIGPVQCLPGLPGETWGRTMAPGRMTRGVR